ncbi:hypothetical protein H0H93_003717, partial [Arthromyces matolae]
MFRPSETFQAQQTTAAVQVMLYYQSYLPAGSHTLKIVNLENTVLGIDWVTLGTIVNVTNSVTASNSPTSGLPGSQATPSTASNAHPRGSARISSGVIGGIVGGVLALILIVLGILVKPLPFVILSLLICSKLCIRSSRRRREHGLDTGSPSFHRNTKEVVPSPYTSAMDDASFVSPSRSCMSIDSPHGSPLDPPNEITLQLQNQDLHGVLRREGDSLIYVLHPASTIDVENGSDIP